MYQKIKIVFQQLLTCDSIEHISTNIIADDKLEHKIKILTKKLFRKYLEGEEEDNKWKQILNHQMPTLPNEITQDTEYNKWKQVLIHQTSQDLECVSNSVWFPISARLQNYVLKEHIEAFFEDSKHAINPTSVNKPPVINPTQRRSTLL
jgi:hypothetical protein